MFILRKWYFPGILSKCKRRGGHCGDFFFHVGHTNENVWMFFKYKRQVIPHITLCILHFRSTHYFYKAFEVSCLVIERTPKIEINNFFVRLIYFLFITSTACYLCSLQRYLNIFDILYQLVFTNDHLVSTFDTICFIYSAFFISSNYFFQ